MQSPHDPQNVDYALDPDLQAYVDGQLSPEEAARVEARLAAEPGAREASAEWRHHRNLIRSAADALDTGPASLRTAALERELLSRMRRRQVSTLLLGRGLGRAAAMVALVAFGWLANDGYSQLVASGQSSYAMDAAKAHALFASDSVRPVEFRRDQMDVALAWLSDKLEYKLESPVLDRLGLEVIGARLIDTSTGPAALFVYEGATGERFSVAMAPNPDAGRNQPFRIVRVNGGDVAYWRGAEYEYAVVGGAPAGLLTTIAAAIGAR